MSDPKRKFASQQLGLYEIRLQGHIPEERKDWFEGMTIINEKEGQAVLRGEIVDQSALHGILNKLRDMNLILVSVKRLSSDRDSKDT